MPARRDLLILLCLVACACGSPARPTPPSAAPPGWPAGTVLTVVSGSDDQPVPGAMVSVAGRSFTADAAGRVTLDALAADFGLLDVVASGFFDRQTVVRSSEGTRIALWPKETVTGLTQHTTAELVYTAGSYCCPAATDLGQYALHRVSPTIQSFTLVLAPDYRRYPQTVAAVQEAAALASAVTGGRVAFVAAEAASGPSIEITAGQDPSNRPLVAAFADRTFNASGYITGGRVVAVDDDFLTEGWSYVDTVAALCHELGHMLGLEHSTAPGVMNSSSDVLGAPYLYFRPHRDYSPVEREVLRLMANRRALNRFPDNDRTATATSPAGDRIVCRR